MQYYFGNTADYESNNSGNNNCIAKSKTNEKLKTINITDEKIINGKVRNTIINTIQMTLLPFYCRSRQLI